MFFYQLVYDPNQKSLNADRGEIRVGSKYQADVPTQPLNTDGNAEGLIKKNVFFLILIYLFILRKSSIKRRFKLECQWRFN